MTWRWDKVMGRSKPPLERAVNGRRLHNRRDLSSLLERERIRCDRTGRAVSLVVIDFDPAEVKRKSVQQWSTVLLETSRILDHVGKMHDRSLWVLLPDTAEAGASAFIRKAMAAAKDDLPAPRFEIMTYPIDSSDDDLNDRGDRASSKDSATERIRREDEHAPSKRNESITPITMTPSAMNPLFAKPVPLWKRSIDVTGSLAGLMLLSPLMFTIAVLVKFSSKGPIFYTQARDGLGGKPFRMYKFRSMITNAHELRAELEAQSEQDGPAFKLTHDPRVTRIGKFIRATSIDELPQLLNVLKGDMTLVGPRPLPCDESAQCEQWQRRRLDVTPGLTCIWQVTGRSRVSFDSWVRMDIDYMRRRSLFFDLSLLVMTIPAVLLGKGAK